MTSKLEVTVGEGSNAEIFKLKAALVRNTTTPRLVSVRIKLTVKFSYLLHKFMIDKGKTKTKKERMIF